VTPSFARQANERAGSKLTIEELVRRRDRGLAD